MNLWFVRRKIRSENKNCGLWKYISLIHCCYSVYEITVLFAVFVLISLFLIEWLTQNPLTWIQPRYRCSDSCRKLKLNPTIIRNEDENGACASPFVRGAVKSQEYSLRPLCPVWNVAVKGFSCGHLSGRDIMILQLEAESWELFISPNSSLHCAEHIKQHRGRTKSTVCRCNYTSINSFTTMTSRAIHFIFSAAERSVALSLLPLESAFIPALWHLTFQRPLHASSDKLHFFINPNALGIINSKWLFRHLSTFVAYRTNAGFCGCKGIFH